MLVSVSHKAFDTYYAQLAELQSHGITHEQATRKAFTQLLDTLARVVQQCFCKLDFRLAC